MRANQLIASVSAVARVLLTTEPTLAQQTTGVPGSPNATTTIDGRYLPPPPLLRSMTRCSTHCCC